MLLPRGDWQISPDGSDRDPRQTDGWSLRRHDGAIDSTAPAAAATDRSLAAATAAAAAAFIARNSAAGW